jgi:hypothetical protein
MQGMLYSISYTPRHGSETLPQPLRVCEDTAITPLQLYRQLIPKGLLATEKTSPQIVTNGNVYRFSPETGRDFVLLLTHCESAFEPVGTRILRVRRDTHHFLLSFLGLALFQGLLPFLFALLPLLSLQLLSHLPHVIHMSGYT